jgi:uncharacterized membrane protein YgcG
VFRTDVLVRWLALVPLRHATPSDPVVIGLVALVTRHGDWNITATPPPTTSSSSAAASEVLDVIACVISLLAGVPLLAPSPPPSSTPPPPSSTPPPPLQSPSPALCLLIECFPPAHLLELASFVQAIASNVTSNHGADGHTSGSGGSGSGGGGSGGGSGGGGGGSGGVGVSVHPMLSTVMNRLLQWPLTPAVAAFVLQVVRGLCLAG